MTWLQVRRQTYPKLIPTFLTVPILPCPKPPRQSLALLPRIIINNNSILKKHKNNKKYDDRCFNRTALTMATTMRTTIMKMMMNINIVLNSINSNSVKKFIMFHISSPLTWTRRTTTTKTTTDVIYLYVMDIIQLKRTVLLTITIIVIIVIVTSTFIIIITLLFIVTISSTGTTVHSLLKLLIRQKKSHAQMPLTQPQVTESRKPTPLFTTAASGAAAVAPVTCAWRSSGRRW